MFVHPQDAGNTDNERGGLLIFTALIWRLLFWGFPIVKEAFVFPLARIFALLMGFALVTKDLFTLIPCKVNLSVFKLKGRYLTLPRALRRGVRAVGSV